MHKFELDFHRPPATSRWGWGLLAAGLTGLAGLAGLHQHLEDEARLQRGTLQRIEARLPGAGTSQPAQAADDAVVAAARRALEESKLPWDGLFTAIEAADNKDVALLAVTPDVVRRQVRIHAEARHLDAMLAYHRRLEAGGGLRQVTLVDHESLKDVAEQPVRFHVIAAWGAENGRP